jgi:two-component system, NarL family, response regulator NreC
MRIILADHHEKPRWALKALLEEQPEFDLVGEADNSQSLLALAENQTADLMLIDSELPSIYLEDLIAGLHALEPTPIVIVMSSEFSNSRKVLKAGADAFVSKADQPDWLLETLLKFESRVRKDE